MTPPMTTTDDHAETLAHQDDASNPAFQQSSSRLLDALFADAGPETLGTLLDVLQGNHNSKGQNPSFEEVPFTEQALTAAELELVETLSQQQVEGPPKAPAIAAFGKSLLSRLQGLEQQVTPMEELRAFSLDKSGSLPDNETIVAMQPMGWTSPADRLGDAKSMDNYSPYRDLSQDMDIVENRSLASESSAMATATLSPLAATSPAAAEGSPRSRFTLTPSPTANAAPQTPLDTDFSGNVQTLIRLVSELPEGVTKQTGAQIIRLTMEAMGISMEEVLSEAQTAQTDMLEAVRANIRKIEELKAIIRRLENDNKVYQGKANELSEIIDLFVLSSPSPSRMNPAAATSAL